MRLIDADVVIFHILLDRGMSEIKKLLLIEDIKKIPTSCPSWFCQHCEHYTTEDGSCRSAEGDEGANETD